MKTFVEKPTNLEQTDGKPRAKSREETTRERETLSRMYKNIFSRWENYKGRYGIPTELNEDFVLVWWLRSGFQSNEAPANYFEYISNYGCIRMNMWHIDKEKKRIIVTNEMYTLGPEGRTRGKGRQSLQGLHHILQSISDSTGYSIYDIATPNEASTPLLTETEGYNAFTQSEEEMLAPTLDDRDRTRWDKMIMAAKPFPTMIKVFAPSSEKIEQTERENNEINTVLDVAMLEREK